MKSYYFVILGILIIACSIISIFGTSFLVLSNLQKLFEQGKFSQAFPSQGPSGYLPSLLEGKVIEVSTAEKPEKIVIDALLNKIDPKAKATPVKISITQATEIDAQNISTQKETPISLSEIKSGDYVIVNTVEDPIFYFSAEGELLKNEFVARKISKLIFK